MSQLSTLTDIEQVKRFRLVILQRFSLEGKKRPFYGERRANNLWFCPLPPLSPCYLRNESGISGAHGRRNKFLDNQRISLRLFSSSLFFSPFFFHFHELKATIIVNPMTDSFLTFQIKVCKQFSNIQMFLKVLEKLLKLSSPWNRLYTYLRVSISILISYDSTCISQFFIITSEHSYIRYIIRYSMLANNIIHASLSHTS